MQLVGRSNIFKIVIIGDSNVGKSELLYRYIGKRSEQNSVPTIGINFYTTLEKFEDGKTLKV